MIFRILVCFIFLASLSCNTANKSDELDEETWKLGWRMIDNYWSESYVLAESQFDSLLSSEKLITDGFLVTGLQVKSKLEKYEEVERILVDQSQLDLSEICNRDFAKDLGICEDVEEIKILNKELQLEIMGLYVADQAIRGNIVHDIISKYSIDTTGLQTEYDYSDPDVVNIDELNRNRLKEIIDEFGFPTNELIGKQAMRGMFFIIQHADGDWEWQKSQITNIEMAVERGDLSKQKYAYLYDRIQVNQGLPQRYGSQFENVDFKNNIAELRETEDVDHLDHRRRQMEMMPVEMYKRMMLSNG